MITIKQTLLSIFLSLALCGYIKSEKNLWYNDCQLYSTFEKDFQSIPKSNLPMLNLGQDKAHMEGYLYWNQADSADQNLYFLFQKAIQKRNIARVGRFFEHKVTSRARTILPFYVDCIIRSFGLVEEAGILQEYVRPLGVYLKSKSVELDYLIRKMTETLFSLEVLFRKGFFYVGLAKGQFGVSEFEVRAEFAELLASNKKKRMTADQLKSKLANNLAFAVKRNVNHRNSKFMTHEMSSNRVNTVSLGRGQTNQKHKEFISRGKVRFIHRINSKCQPEKFKHLSLYVKRYRKLIDEFGGDSQQINADYNFCVKMDIYEYLIAVEKFFQEFGSPGFKWISVLLVIEGVLLNENIGDISTTDFKELLPIWDEAKHTNNQNMKSNSSLDSSKIKSQNSSNSSQLKGNNTPLRNNNNRTDQESNSTKSFHSSKTIHTQNISLKQNTPKPNIQNSFEESTNSQKRFSRTGSAFPDEQNLTDFDEVSKQIMLRKLADKVVAKLSGSDIHVDRRILKFFIRYRYFRWEMLEIMYSIHHLKQKYARRFVLLMMSDLLNYVTERPLIFDKNRDRFENIENDFIHVKFNYPKTDTLFVSTEGSRSVSHKPVFVDFDKLIKADSFVSSNEDDLDVNAVNFNKKLIEKNVDGLFIKKLPPFAQQKSNQTIQDNISHNSSTQTVPLNTNFSIPHSSETNSQITSNSLVNRNISQSSQIIHSPSQILQNKRNNMIVQNTSQNTVLRSHSNKNSSQNQTLLTFKESTKLNNSNPTNSQLQSQSLSQNTSKGKFKVKSFIDQESQATKSNQTGLLIAQRKKYKFKSNSSLDTDEDHHNLTNSQENVSAKNNSIKNAMKMKLNSLVTTQLANHLVNISSQSNLNINPSQISQSKRTSQLNDSNMTYTQHSLKKNSRINDTQSHRSTTPNLKTIMQSQSSKSKPLFRTNQMSSQSNVTSQPNHTPSIANQSEVIRDSAKNSQIQNSHYTSQNTSSNSNNRNIPIPKVMNLSNTQKSRISKSNTSNSRQVSQRTTQINDQKSIRNNQIRNTSHKTLTSHPVLMKSNRSKKPIIMQSQTNSLDNQRQSHLNQSQRSNEALKILNLKSFNRNNFTSDVETKKSSSGKLFKKALLDRTNSYMQMNTHSRSQKLKQSQIEISKLGNDRVSMKSAKITTKMNMSPIRKTSNRNKTGLNSGQINHISPNTTNQKSIMKLDIDEDQQILNSGKHKNSQKPVSINNQIAQHAIGQNKTQNLDMDSRSQRTTKSSQKNLAVRSRASNISNTTQKLRKENDRSGVTRKSSQSKNRSQHIDNQSNATNFHRQKKVIENKRPHASQKQKEKKKSKPNKFKQKSKHNGILYKETFTNYHPEEGRNDELYDYEETKSTRFDDTLQKQIEVIRITRNEKKFMLLL